MTEFTNEDRKAVDLTIGLGNTLDLILLLDSVTVGRSAGSVDDLISQALSNGLDVSERGLSGAGGHQVDSLVDSAEGGHIHSLSSHHTGRADSGGILAGATVDDSINVHLNGVLVGQDVNELKSVSNNANSQQLLAVVSAGAHQSASEALNDGALYLKDNQTPINKLNITNDAETSPVTYVGLLEALSLISASSVSDEGGVLALDGDEIL